MEVNTAALIAKELRALGIDVTEKVGRMGVVGVLRNGPGPTVLLRTDMDALPLKETTGVPYASTAVVKDLQGRDQPAMHACGHDVHMTSFIGAARTLVAVRDRWSGTIVFVAQPAEEIVAGARAMLDDGLYTRFPKPDFALTFHDDAMLPAGKVGYREGPFMSGVSSMDIVVRGVSGHGSAPHTAKDPVVLASQIVVALQTIVSREVAPGTRAVVTVGTIHGGLKRNIIPDEVKLELTLRAFDPAVMAKLVSSIRRITAGTAQAAGVPEDRLPDRHRDRRNHRRDGERSGVDQTAGQGLHRVDGRRPGVGGRADQRRRGLLALRPDGGARAERAVAHRRERAREVHRERAHRRARALEPQFGLRARAGADHHRRGHHDDRRGARAARQEVIRPCPT